MSRLIPPVLLVALLTPLPMPAQSTLDHVPPDALGALIVRDLAGLQKKGDKLLKDAAFEEGMRFSQLVPFLFVILGIPAGDVDDSQPIGLIVANPKLVDPKRDPRDSVDKSLVVLLPIRSQETIEKTLKLEAGILKGGKVVKVPERNSPLGRNIEYVTMRGKHVYLGFHEKTVEAVARTKGIAAELTEGQRKLLTRSDVLLHLGTEAWGELWKDLLRDARRNLELGADDAEKKIAGEIIEALKGVQFGLGSLRLDDGIGLSFLSVFPKQGNEAARKFLAAFRGGDGASSLRGLPEGNVVAATAAKGDGTQNAAVARVLLRVLAQTFLVPNQVLGASDRPVLLSIFSEVWQRLRGSRLALYKTADAGELGLFSLVGILDTEDPQKFLEELKQLAKLGGAEGLDLKTEAGKKANEDEIRKLVADLGHRRFQVRQSAEAKLRLAGDQILPYLEKAIESGDLEVRRRAELLKREIVSAAEEARKELLSGKLARTIKPSFVFLDRKEKVEGLEVQQAGVKLTKKDAAFAPQLKALLGPDWNRIRFAAHGKQVVVLVGSDLGLFQKAIRNLKEDKPGLAAVKLLEPQTKQTDGMRKLELHASAQMVALLATAADLEKPAKAPPPASLTSVSLSVETDRVQVDFWVPVQELKVILAAGRGR